MVYEYTKLSRCTVHNPRNLTVIKFGKVVEIIENVVEEDLFYKGVLIGNIKARLLQCLLKVFRIHSTEPIV